MDSLGATHPANSCPLTPLGFLERAATVFSDCPSVVYHDTVFTWPQTFRRCLRLASALVSLGISRRDIVSVLLPNVPAMYKDVIISGGENISSVEVESELYGHPTVNDTAVVARPDEFWGETPCAFVSLKDGAAGSVTADEIIAWSRERMPHYMVPKTVVFLPELPKTSTGKVQKYVLRHVAKKMGPVRKGNSSKL